LIPTGGSELAHKGVVQGLSLAKSVGAKVTALVVEANIYGVPTSWMNRIFSAVAEYAEHANERALKVLSGVADEARSVGVSCETVQTTREIRPAVCHLAARAPRLTARCGPQPR